MNIDNFEDRIKDAFGRYRPDTDNDAIWENIEPHLKRKKKRRAVLFFLWGLGLGMLLLLCWLTVRPLAAPAGNDLQTENAARPDPKETPARSRNFGPGREDRKVIFPENKPANSGSTDRTKSESASGKSAATAASAAPLPAGVKNEATAPVVAPTGIEPGNREIEGKGVALAVPPILGKPQNGPIALKSGAHHHPPPLNAITPAGTTDGQADPETQKGKKRRKKLKFGPLNLEHNLGIQAGPAFGARRLTAREGAIVPSGYLDGREKTERSLASFNAGAFYFAATPKGFLLKTGLDYRQANEKFRLAYTEKKTETINGVLTQTVDASGNIVSQNTGPKTVTVTTEYSNTDYNRYHFVNLPIGLGYRHSGEKSRWELSGGVDINLFFRTGGTMYSRNLVPLRLEHGNLLYKEVFRRNTGTGAWASWTYSRKLNERLWWQVSASFQTPFNPVTKPEYELAQRYFHFGMMGGVCYFIEN